MNINDKHKRTERVMCVRNAVVICKYKRFLCFSAFQRNGRGKAEEFTLKNE